MLTVLIATRNGSRTLPDVLARYCALETPAGGWRLVVVDNGSTDDTREIVLSFEKRLPIAYSFEAKNGKNAALNTGLAFASGDLVVFSDDDTFPQIDWLVQLREAADAQPAFGMFGGVVLPRWETSPPNWILRWVPPAIAYSISDSRLSGGAVDAGKLFGPNLAIRAELFDRGYRFDPSIGPSNSHFYPMGSETEFVLRLQKQAIRAWYVREAVVEHFVRTTQLRPLWLLGRAFRAGRGECRLGLLNSSSVGPRRLGLPRCLLRLARWAGSAFLAFLTLDPQKLFRSSWSLCAVCGYVFEALTGPNAPNASGIAEAGEFRRAKPRAATRPSRHVDQSGLGETFTLPTSVRSSPK